jgi:hypothetical protein
MPIDMYTPEWAKNAVFYQIFPDRFAGSERVKKRRDSSPGIRRPLFTVTKAETFWVLLKN